MAAWPPGLVETPGVAWGDRVPQMACDLIRDQRTCCARPPLRRIGFSLLSDAPGRQTEAYPTGLHNRSIETALGAGLQLLTRIDVHSQPGVAGIPDPVEVPPRLYTSFSESVTGGREFRLLDKGRLSDAKGALANGWIRCTRPRGRGSRPLWTDRGVLQRHLPGTYARHATTELGLPRRSGNASASFPSEAEQTPGKSSSSSPSAAN